MQEQSRRDVELMRLKKHFLSVYFAEKAAFYRELSAKLMSQVHTLVYELGEARRQLRHEKE